MNILSYNIQATIGSSSYFSYISQFYKHLFLTESKKRTLKKIGDYISSFDVVCLQEIDLGGLRNGFHDHTEALQRLGSFPYFENQMNRRIIFFGLFLSIHGNVIFSKRPIRLLFSKLLPSGGRGILGVEVETEDGPLVIANTHLSLAESGQLYQLKFIIKLLEPYSRILFVGDFNCLPNSKPIRYLEAEGFRMLGSTQATFPSWKPKKKLDYAFVRGDVQGTCSVSDALYSDHLPINIKLDA